MSGKKIKFLRKVFNAVKRQGHPNLKWRWFKRNYKDLMPENYNELIK